MNNRYIVLAAFLTGCTAAHAQHTEKQDSALNRTVVVENLYNPDIMNAQKINVMPTLEEPQSTKKDIEYATGARPAGSFRFSPMENFGHTPEQSDAYKGYLRGGYGNRGNVDARLNYRFTPGKHDVLNLSLGLRGMSGDIDIPDSEEEWEARTYRTQVGADWEHRFDRLTLDVQAQGESQVFNRLNETNPHQHQLFGGIQAAIRNKEEARIHFSAGTGIHYARQKHALPDDAAFNETEIKTRGLVSGKINDRSDINIGLGMENRFYSNGMDSRTWNIHTLSLNPYYRLRGEQWNVRLGAHVDPRFGDGDNGLSIAPDLYGDYTLSQGFRFYAQATGGRTLNDFREINRRYSYSDLFLLQGILAEDSYTKMDGRVGLKAAPMNGLDLHVYTGYRSTEDELFNCYTSDAIVGLCQDDADALYIGASAEYSWKDLFTTRAGVEWQKWNADLTDLYPTLHPELTFHWTADFHPIEALRIGLSYTYEQRVKSDGASRPDAVNNLGATVSYRLLPYLTLYTRGDNLLNQSYCRQMAHPVQGINILAGAAVEF